MRRDIHSFAPFLSKLRAHILMFEKLLLGGGGGGGKCKTQSYLK